MRERERLGEIRKVCMQIRSLTEQVSEMSDKLVLIKKMEVKAYELANFIEALKIKS